MPDPIAAAPAAQSAAIFRGLVLDPALVLDHALDPGEFARIVAEEAGPTRDRLFTPETTVAALLSQVSWDDHSCRGAVARLLAWRVASGLPACSPDAGGYCKARLRLPESLLPRLTRHLADRVGDRAPGDWRFRGRRVVIADGSGLSMADTPENQAEYPQHREQVPGCGFPLARIVVLICLATGCVLDAALGASRGKLTGEMALVRSLHGRLRRGDVLLADACYSSFDEVMGPAGLGVDVVMRRNGNRRSDSRRGTRLGREGHVARWQRDRNRRAWMGREEFAALPRVMTTRELRVRAGRPGFRTRCFEVVTSLLDPAAFPAEELASLYRRRWHGEVCQADYVSSDTLYRCPGRSDSGRLGVVGIGPMVSSTPRSQPGATVMPRHIERRLPPRLGIIRDARSA